VLGFFDGSSGAVRFSGKVEILGFYPIGVKFYDSVAEWNNGQMVQAFHWATAR